MTDTFVVIFPSIFTQNKLDALVSNIKNVLKIQNQKFSKIQKDGHLIIVEANDPVFASSAINLLYGIEQIAIAKQVKNEFNTIVSTITKIGTNLLLKGERFLVKVEGHSSGFLPKDVEIAATSSLIEKAVNLGAKPGSEEKHDKLIYTHLTKLHAYVCIFTDRGHGGIPYKSQNEKIVCCIYDELSALACLEAIREGFDVKVIVCYEKGSELTNLIKILNRLIPRIIQDTIELEFYQSTIKNHTKNYLFLVEVVTELLCNIARRDRVQKISLAISPLIFSSNFVNSIIKKVIKRSLLPWLPLVGLDRNIFDEAKEIGLGKHLSRIEKLAKMRLKENTKQNAITVATQAIKTRKDISVRVGPNTVHEILDSLK